MTTDRLLNAIEVHDPEGIRQYFEQGGSPNDILDGTPLFTILVEMYTRTPRFHACVRSFVEAGLIYHDQALLAVLTDDGARLETLLQEDLGWVSRQYTLYRNTFSPLTGGTLLHFCAEYDSIACGKALMAAGADINAPAARDTNGFGGHSPIFHTVNQNNDNSRRMLQLLLDAGADLLFPVRGLIWGQGYDWETFIPAVNPVSYAMMGLLPQMHRKQETVAATVSLLMRHAYGIDYTPANVPNRYLQS